VIPAPPRRGWAILAWPVILVVVVLAIIAGRLPRAAEVNGDEDQVGLVVMELQARYLLGAAEFTAGLGGGDRASMYEQAKALNTGSIEQRLRFIVLAGELAGPAEARKQIGRLNKAMKDAGVKPTAKQAAVKKTLERLYGDYAKQRYDAPSLSKKDRQRLHEELGWFGDLALAPAGQPGLQKAVLAAAGGPAAGKLRHSGTPNPEERQKVLAPARRSFYVTLGAFGVGLMFFLIGLGLLLLFSIFLYTGTVRGALRCGSPNGGLYAETFAVWMVLYPALSICLALLFPEASRLLLGMAAMLLSLLALAWPVLRGVPWREVREEVGLTAGQQPATEPLFGVGCYIMSIPILGAGLVVTLLLLAAQRGLEGPGETDNFDPAQGPAHPIVKDVAEGGWEERVLIILLACVVAPLVEETMFRGVLYRHLREASRRLHGLLSFLISAFVVSLVFAAVHPQGVFAIPVLMALALGFTIAREWRGSLVPAMVAHGLSNGLVMTFSLLSM
jgi:membrane protease YdiL (CAAX protease family)